MLLKVLIVKKVSMATFHKIKESTIKKCSETEISKKRLIPLKNSRNFWVFFWKKNENKTLLQLSSVLVIKTTNLKFYTHHNQSWET